MTTVALAPIPFLRFTSTSTGLALIGGQVFTFVAGTTTPQSTYTDSTGSTANTNPIILNTRGECSCYLDASLVYKLVVKDSLGNTIATYDNIQSGAPFPMVNVRNFGAKGDGVTDDTAAINAAIASVVASGGRVYVPAGTYKTSATITLGGSGIALVGAGIGATTLKQSVAATPLLTLTSGSNRLTVSDMTLDSSVARTSGGHGIISPGVVSSCTLENLQVLNQYNGFQLGATDSSILRHCFTQQNYNSGIAITTVNTGSGGGCQWTLQNIVSQLNDANGIEVRGTAFSGVSQMTLGGFFDVNLFANTGFGLVALGTVGCPIFGVRINGFFSGQNGSDSIFLDTFANQHNISNFYLEIDGTSATGRTFSTPATHAAHGCTLTSSNKAMRMSSGLIKAPSLGGIVNQCSERLLFNDVAIEDAGGSVANVGFYHNTATGRLVMTGCSSGNTAAGTSQTFGLFADDGSLVSAVGCDFSNNATGAFSATANGALANIVGGFPTSLGTQLAGGVVLGAATGGNKGVGTINVATNEFKNGTAYNNP